MRQTEKGKKKNKTKREIKERKISIFSGTFIRLSKMKAVKKSPLTKKNNFAESILIDI